MNIVAFYRIFSGHEFVKASIDSIIDHVDKIVCLSPTVSWAGFGTNTCLSVVRNLAKHGKYKDKLDIIETNEKDQITQFNDTYQYINEKYTPNWIMVIDTDEVWDNFMLNKAKAYLEQYPDWNVFTSKLYTYVKSPYYRVHLPEELRPVVFVKGNMNQYGSKIRSCDLTERGKKFIAMDDVYFHHFSYVRESFNDIVYKFFNSHVSENQPHEQLDYWIVEKWSKLPDVLNFHPALGFQHNWNSCKVVTEGELPVALHGSLILSKYIDKKELYLPEWLLLEDDFEVIRDFAYGKELYVEVGTYKGASAIWASTFTDKVVTIDCYNLLPLAAREVISIESEVRETLKIYSNIDVRKAISYEEAINFEDESIDVLFIDGDHRYEGVVKDARFFLPKVKVGGHILFHDYNDVHRDVVLAVKDFERKNNSVCFVPLSTKYDKVTAMRVIKKLEHRPIEEIKV